jgi:Ca-activated chloride channel family protein
MGVIGVKRLLAMLLAIMMLFPSTAIAAPNKGFKLLTTPENELLIKYVEDYCRQTNVDLSVTYMGDIDAINELSVKSDQYDAVWLSNSMWLYRLDQSVSVTDSKSTGIVPIVVGIKPELYSESIKTMGDLIQLEGGFGIPSITRSDAGASSYLGIYYSLCGSPRMLTMDQAKDQEIRDQIYSYMKENSEIYSTYEDLVQLVKAGKNDYYYGYESEFIRLNMEYGTTLKLLYLEDGVPLADKPFAYVDNKDSRKKEIFLGIQNHLLKNSTQKEMCRDGIRTGYGGQVPYAKKEVFNADWGIDTQKYLAPMNYPSKEVTTELLNFYTYGVSKPANYIFCLDFSGSMRGEGHKDMVEAMTTLFNDEIASKYFIQMKETDKVTLILFSNYANEGVKISYEDFGEIPKTLKSIKPEGGTNIYKALIEASKHVISTSSGYSNYVVLLTDGQSEEDFRDTFIKNYNVLKEKYPIYSITMGSADEEQLEKLAELSGGKIFNGKTDLVSAFKTLRGYN